MNGLNDEYALLFEKRASIDPKFGSRVEANHSTLLIVESKSSELFCGLEKTNHTPSCHIGNKRDMFHQERVS